MSTKTKTKTTAREEVLQAATAAGWTVTDLGEVTFRTQGSFGRDGVTHVTQALEIEWEGQPQPRYLAFFKPSGSFHLAVNDGPWETIQRKAAERAEQRVAWYHNTNERTAQACRDHGVEIGVPYPKRKGMVPGGISHSIVNDAKEYLVLAPYSEETIARAKAEALASETYTLLGRYRLSKTDLLGKLATTPAVIAERRRAQEAEREAQRRARVLDDLAQAQEAVEAASGARTQAQADTWETVTAAVLEYGAPGITEDIARGIATLILVEVQQEEGPIARLLDATRNHHLAQARVANLKENLR